MVESSQRIIEYIENQMTPISRDPDSVSLDETHPRPVFPAVSGGLNGACTTELV